MLSSPSTCPAQSPDDQPASPRGAAMRTDRRMFLGLAAGAVAIPITGCAPGGSAPAGGSANAPSDVNTDPGSIAETSITTMDTWTDKTSMQAQWITAVNAAF